ncbi:MAG: hypothetical protein AAFN50_07525 [Pseudomonadota bacterium]
MKTQIRNAISNPAWVCFLWAGMTVAITMVATPARFTAITATREIALDVGRVVFAAHNKAELAALVLLLVVVRVSGRAATFWPYCAALALIVLAQAVWLMPELSARTDIVVAGGTPPPSYVHGVYSSLELVKLALLFWVGFSCLGRGRVAT